MVQGLGVEKSCPAALLYYEPVASSVVSAATVNGGLPTMNDMRLGDKKRLSRPSPSAEQEFLHYQWFADYGHAEAARAVAHLLTHGEEQNLISALDYLLQAAEMGDADAMAHVGHAYANGIAVAQNNVTARSWFTKAAEKGPLYLNIIVVGRFKLTVVYCRTSKWSFWSRLDAPHRTGVPSGPHIGCQVLQEINRYQTRLDW